MRGACKDRSGTWVPSKCVTLRRDGESSVSHNKASAIMILKFLVVELIF